MLFEILSYIIVYHWACTKEKVKHHIQDLPCLEHIMKSLYIQKRILLIKQLESSCYYCHFGMLLVSQICFFAENGCLQICWHCQPGTQHFSLCKSFSANQNHQPLHLQTVWNSSLHSPQPFCTLWDVLVVLGPKVRPSNCCGQLWG